MNSSKFSKYIVSCKILSNGKYKGVLHQALANDKATRISIAMPHGPSLDTVIRPAPEFVDNESHPPKYIEITYKEYVKLLLSGQICSKFRLDFEQSKAVYASWLLNMANFIM